MRQLPVTELDAELERLIQETIAFNTPPEDPGDALSRDNAITMVAEDLCGYRCIEGRDVPARIARDDDAERAGRPLLSDAEHELADQLLALLRHRQ